MPQTRETVVFEFPELDESAQEKAAEWFAGKQAEWIEPEELDDSDYWQERFFEPNGIEIDPSPHKWQSGISWSLYPSYAWFSGKVDLETYIRNSKLGNRFRLLLWDLLHGETSPRATFEIHEYGKVESEIFDPGFYGDLESPDSSLDPEYRRYRRLHNQARELEDLINETLGDIAGEIASGIAREYEYRTSLENAREYLTEDPESYLFLEDGSPSPVR